MFEPALTAGTDAGRLPVAPTAGDVHSFARSLAGDTRQLDDAERIDLIRALEVLKCAAEGARAAVTAEFDASQRQRAADRGVRHPSAGGGASHTRSPSRGGSRPIRGSASSASPRCSWPRCPTLAALRSGHITEWQATLVARESACLSLADRLTVDRRLCGDRTTASQMGVREIGDRARRLAAELDPASVAERRSQAEADRCVTVRPAPDTMTWLTGHLPVKQGVAVYAALKAEAERQVGVGGECRSRSQIMADSLVERVLGSFEARTPGGEPGVTVNVVISADSLLGWADESAQVPG